MPDIAANIKLIREQIPSSVKLVAVSKTKPAADIMRAYDSGQRCFGENRVQELLRKRELLPDDIEWHLIGHLQRNKVKYIVPFIGMIQSVDTFRLLREINSEAEKCSRIVDCLLQVYIADEETKFGFSMDELKEMMSNEEFLKLKNINICGLMGMATFTGDNKKITGEFSYLAGCFRELKSTYFADNNNFKEISMGMSGDYSIAVQEGSTIIRIGSLIFGDRN